MMFTSFKKCLKKQIKKFLSNIFPQIEILEDPDIDWRFITNSFKSSNKGKEVKIYPPYHIYGSNFGDYTYIAQNSYITNANIGKFCSIGPNLICGWGMHPTHGISSHPMFYSTLKQNGITLSDEDKIEELAPIEIGNDVFIGANVTILNGVVIGDGAIIGAGAVVSKDIPPYAVAIGSPILIKRYRFEKETIEELLKIKWWDFSESSLQDVEKHFFDIKNFTKLYKDV